jgi:hypothetical protein
VSRHVPGQIWGLEDKRGYLLPKDADPNSEEISGYSVDMPYANLIKRKARSITALMHRGCSKCRMKCGGSEIPSDLMPL